MGSWLLILGLATRLAASAILGKMSVAIYHALVTSGFNINFIELMALYFSSAIAKILLGPGIFSVDFLINEVLINKFMNSGANLNNKKISKYLSTPNSKKSLKAGQ